MPDSIVNIKEDERIIIQRAYRKLLRSIKSDVTKDDKDNIRTAYELAVKAHETQRRKSGEPYILHPIEVARICAEEIGLGPTAVICALLHDVVEDTDITLDEIQQMFGEKVAKIVDGLTKLDGSFNSESPQAENFKKVLSTLVDDVRVVLIKMADRLHNMRTLGSMPRHKQLKIAAETSYIYAPLAHRLGLYNLRSEFQDLCMKITEPESYQELSRKLQETKSDRNSYINEFIKPLSEHLDDMGITYRIVGRSKSISSIWNKIRTKRIPFEEIYDLFAIRIIVDVPKIKEKSISWQVYSIVTDVYRPVPERLKDWITTPKSNGYESLHTTVIGPKGRFVEVQIRSDRMDEIAERGFAAHWKYKGVSGQENVYETWLDNIREILEEDDKDALDFMTDFKSNLFNEEVYIYTPKGDMRILPKGATALDFAFDIHTEIGYHCAAIKVANKLVPMGYVLENGDQITITTNKNQKPNESWLKLVTTGKAKSKIRTALKEESKKRGEFGREQIERKFDHNKIDFEDNMDLLVKAAGFKSRLDFYVAVADELINLNDLLKKFKVEGNKLIPIEDPEKKPQPKVDVEVQPSAPTQAKSGKSPLLRINGDPADNIEFSLANCCNPLHGDDIFAYITSSAGIKIHRTNCPNATNLMANYGYRVMKADWMENSDSSFVATLQITGIDDGPGIIERLSHKISSNLGLNMRSFSIEGNQGYFEGKVSILVKNKDQLYQAITAIKALNNISSVTRIE
ncbi:MAG: RelA/SpoT family protein [Saprospiraceae bacterium]